MNNASRPLWRLLVLASESDKSVELTCAECLALLEYDTDLLEAGTPIDQIRPSIMRHLSLCSACQTYYDSWLTTLEENSKT
jgi:hypothetical protein